MSTKIIPLLFKNLFRNKMRLLATAGCCLIAGLIIGFSLMAEHSLGRVMDDPGGGLNLVMTKKDTY